MLFSWSGRLLHPTGRLRCGLHLVRREGELGREPASDEDGGGDRGGGAAHPARIAVITGGEPLMHDLGPLTAALRAAGFRTHIETSGAHPFSGEWHHVCLSPKKFKAALPEAFMRADELKVIVFNKHDLTWAEEQARNRPSCLLYLQPEWDKREDMMPLITEHVKAHPRWRVSLQTHKYLNIP